MKTRIYAALAVKEQQSCVESRQKVGKGRGDVERQLRGVKWHGELLKSRCETLKDIVKTTVHLMVTGRR